MLALPGGAYVYQGEELGLAGGRGPARRACSQDPTWERSGHTDRGRDGCRVPLPWSGDAPPFGFGPDGVDAPWLPQPATGRELHRRGRRPGDPGSMLDALPRGAAAAPRAPRPRRRHADVARPARGGAGLHARVRSGLRGERLGRACRAPGRVQRASEQRRPRRRRTARGDVSLADSSLKSHKSQASRIVPADRSTRRWSVCALAALLGQWVTSPRAHGGSARRQPRVVDVCESPCAPRCRVRPEASWSPW